MNTSSIFLIILTSLSVSLSQGSISPAIMKNESKLEFNGQYTYRLLGFYKLFEISLYLPSSYEIEKIPTEQPLSLRFIYNRPFTSEQITSQGDKALAREFTEQEREPYATALARLNAAYRDVKKGDSYRLDYIPTKGLILSLNRKELITISDQGFAQYYLRIWLGQRDDCQPILQKLVPQLQFNKS